MCPLARGRCPLAVLRLATGLLTGYKLTVIARTITQIFKTHVFLCNVKSIVMKCRVTFKSKVG